MRQERTTFEQVWQGYIQQVSQLLEKQVSERTEALATFDSTEDAWKSQLEEATAELGRQSSQTEFRECIDLEEDEDAEMDRKEALVADAVEEEVKTQAKRQAAREQAEANARQLLQAIKSFKEEGQGSMPREGSRTPRRGASKEREEPPKEPPAALITLLTKSHDPPSKPEERTPKLPLKLPGI